MYSATVQFKTLTSGTPNAVRYILAALAGVAVVGIGLMILAAVRRRGQPSPPKQPAGASPSSRVSS
jgi:hypothetical protein